jgi:lipopolysaccharide heptosyltransferase II
METEEIMIERILLTRMKYIGDVVLTTPIIRTLRETYPEAYIAYLGDAKAVSLLQNNPFLDEIIPFDFSKDTLAYQLKMYALMFSKKFDLTIDLFSNPRSALMSFATRAQMRIGGNSKGRGRLYTHRISDDGKLKSAIEYHYMSLKPLGILPKHYKTEIFVTDSEKDEAQKKLQSLGIDRAKKTVVLHPGGTWPAKLWQKEKFSELAHLLKDEGKNVILSGAKNDETIVNFVAEQANVVPLGLIPIRQAAAVFSVCDLVISNDCGVMHVAVAVNTPTIGIFGPGEDNIWFPYQFPHRIFRKHVPCNPCHLNVCTRTGGGFMECMGLLSTTEVYQAAKEML